MGVALAPAPAVSCCLLSPAGVGADVHLTVQLLGALTELVCQMWDDSPWDRCREITTKQFLLQNAVFLSGYCCTPRKRKSNKPKPTVGSNFLRRGASAFSKGCQQRAPCFLVPTFKGPWQCHPCISIFWLQGLKARVTNFGHSDMWNTVMFFVLLTTAKSDLGIRFAGSPPWLFF